MSKRVDLYDLFDIDPVGIIYYRQDNNQFETYQGDVIYNLWDFFTPSQVSNFKKKSSPVKRVLTKQLKRVDVVYI